VLGGVDFDISREHEKERKKGERRKKEAGKRSGEGVGETEETKEL